MKSSSFYLFIISVCLVCGLFKVKHQVAALEMELAHTQGAIRDTTESLQVLKAEWNYLNRPDHIRQLAHKLTDLRPPTHAAIFTSRDAHLERLQHLKEASS